MTPGFLTAFGASLLAGAVTTAGIFMIRRHETWAREQATLFA